MKKIFCTFALTGLLSLGMAGSAALAQDNAAPQAAQEGHGRRGMNPEMQLKHLTRELNLSAEQQTQIKPILESRDQQAQQLWQDQSMSREDRHAKMKAIQDDSKAKIEAALNDTQKQKYEAMQAQMEQRRHGGPGGPGGPGGDAPQPQQ
jgi:periplasmic protein CpxP/Spy